jgi:hypothetical protein
MFQIPSLLGTAMLATTVLVGHTLQSNTQRSQVTGQWQVPLSRKSALQVPTSPKLHQVPAFRVLKHFIVQITL